MDPKPTIERPRNYAAQQAPRCEHIRLNGVRCAAPALRDHEYCHFHDHSRNSRIFLNSDLPFIEDATSLQFVLMEVIRTLSTGSADPRVCALLLYSLQIACSNLKNFLAERREAAESEPPQIAAGEANRQSDGNANRPSLEGVVLGKLVKDENQAEPPRIHSRQDYYTALAKRISAAGLPAKDRPNAG